MIKLPVYNISGEKIEDFVLTDDNKDLKFNDDLVAQAIRVEQNRIQIESGKAKTRAEVKGGGKKPWRQKGTGRARAGSLRSPLFKGGGVTFGPTGLKRKLVLPAKMRKAAYLMLLSKKSLEKEVIILSDIKIADKKTKSAGQAVSALKLNGSILLIVNSKDRNDVAPWRNLGLVEVVESGNLLLGDFLKNKIFVYSSNAAKDLKDKGKK